MARHEYSESGSGFCGRCDDLPGQGEHAPEYKYPEEIAAEAERTSGVSLIAAERQRQIDVEGYDADHDSDEQYDRLARAAACYATPASHRVLDGHLPSDVPELWPWEERFWKPTPNDRVRELVKAGALIAAEIDRLNRFSEVGNGQD